LSFRKSTIIESAQKLAAKGQYEKAIQEWEKLITETPNDGNVYNSIGDLYLKAGQKAKATDVFINAADAFQSAGFEMKSIAVYKKALKVDPSRVQVFEKLARVYAERGLIGNAIDEYLLAAKHYLQQNDFQASLSVYRKISSLDPENSDILIEIADMCEKQGHKAESIEEYKKAVKLLEKNKRSAEADKVATKILELDASYIRDDAPAFQTPEQAPKDEADVLVTDEQLLSTAHESPSFESDAPHGDISGLLEPEPERMTNEQTLYASEVSFQEELTVEDEAGGGTAGKPLESYLTEADVYTQYGLLEKAIHQLDAAAERFPTAVQPHLKLKNLYQQLGDTGKAIEECSTLAKLYEDIGDEPNRQAILDELMAIPSEAKEEPLDLTAMDDSHINETAHEESGLDHAEQLTVENEDSPFDEQDISFEDLTFEDEATQLDQAKHNQQEDVFVGAKEDGPDFDRNEGPVLSEVVSDLDFGANIRGHDASIHETHLESKPAPFPPAPEIESMDLRSTEEAAREDSNEDPLFTGDELDIFSAGFDEPTLASTDLKEVAPATKGPTEEYIDLQAIISEDLLEEENETTLERTIRSFQGKAQEANNAKEIETQYDLGIAYKEMEMIPEAISAFETAAQGEHRFKDAMTMLVICHRRNGTANAAISMLKNTLSTRKCDQATMIALKYELALLQDQQGNKKEAAILFEEIFKMDPNFREVASKRSSFENDASPAWSDSSEKTFPREHANPKKKDRVSYL